MMVARQTLMAIGNFSRMLHQQLSRLKSQLHKKEINVSDGLLMALKALRGSANIDEESLTWLNLELLGYRPEDLETLSQATASPTQSSGLAKIVRLWSPARTNKVDQIKALRPPDYRFLQGAWGHIDQSGRLLTVTESTTGLTHKSIFCNIGVTQLESQLLEMDDPMSGLFSMSFDSATGLEFYCYSKELVRILDSVREKLIDFIDQAIQQDDCD